MSGDRSLVDCHLAGELLDCLDARQVGYHRASPVPSGVRLMLPLSASTLDLPARTVVPVQWRLFVAVAAVLFAGCAVNPVPTPSKSGGGQYEGKDADTSLAASDAVSGAVDGTPTGADASDVASAAADSGQSDTAAVD